MPATARARGRPRTMALPAPADSMTRRGAMPSPWASASPDAGSTTSSTRHRGRLPRPERPAHTRTRSPGASAAKSTRSGPPPDGGSGAGVPRACGAATGAGRAGGRTGFSGATAGIGEASAVATGVADGGSPAVAPGIVRASSSFVVRPTSHPRSPVAANPPAITAITATRASRSFMERSADRGSSLPDRRSRARAGCGHRQVCAREGRTRRTRLQESMLRRVTGTDHDDCAARPIPASTSSTRASCPSGFTLRKTLATFPEVSMTNVLRTIPRNFLP